MFLVGLTGGIATGKSTVSKYFQLLGCPVVDADKIAREGHQFVILDLPLLFETGQMVPYMTYTVVVACSEDEQLNRLMSRNNYTKEEATKRIQAQMSLDEKRYRAAYVVENDGSLSDTEEQVEELFRELRLSKAHWKLRIIVFACVDVLAIFGYWTWTKIAAII